MRYKVLLLVFTVVCASCAQRADINYRIVTGQPLQVMEHFGASDAWSMHVLGKWPEEKQKQIADWLFSTENDANGKPKGIGLSLWRFNLWQRSARVLRAGVLRDLHVPVNAVFRDRMGNARNPGKLK